MNHDLAGAFKGRLVGLFLLTDTLSIDVFMEVEYEMRPAKTHL